jgi:hypothetical protein
MVNLYPSPKSHRFSLIRAYTIKLRTFALHDCNSTVEDSNVCALKWYTLLKPASVEFVIQILKKAAKLASEAEARRREAWAGAQRGQLAWAGAQRGQLAFPQPRDAWGVRGAEPPAVRIVLGFHLYKYLCKPQEISISIVNLLRSVTT